MRSHTRRALAAVVTSLVLLAGWGTGAAPAEAASGSGSSGGGGGGADNSPPFDFTDAYYAAHGVDPSGISGRATGTGISVVDTAPDANHRNVRLKLTLPAYDTSGKQWYFTVLGDLTPTAFPATPAGTQARQLAEASPVYVFPTRTGDQLGVGNSRQADMIDMSNGYFSNNPLGLWVHVFVAYTAKASDTPDGRKTLDDLAKKNGLALDGTPIITSKSDLDKLSKAGYATLTKRPVTATGRYFLCPVLKDPRHGGIAPDAFLATVRQTDGSPLPAEASFVTTFNALQSTGDYPR